jgi:hypothetical protein
MLVTMNRVRVIQAMQNAPEKKNDRILCFSSGAAKQRHEWISIDEFGLQIGTHQRFAGRNGGK